MKLKCTKSDDRASWVTVDKIYVIIQETEDHYVTIDDNQIKMYVVKSTMQESPGYTSYENKFALIKDSEYPFTTPEENEEWQRLEQKQSEQFVDCPVAIAYHIHELQKWLKHIGCDSEAEFRISSDYVWASSDTSATYEAKEGGVGTLIEYMRHIGGANKCVEKMESVG